MKTQVSKFLRNTSVWLNLDTGYFLRGTFWGSLQQIVGVGSGLFLSYLFGHFTSKQVFGEYNLVLSYLSLLTFVSLPGLDTALVATTGKKHDASYSLAVKRKLQFSFLGIPVLLFVGLFYLLHAQTILGLTFVLSALSYPLLNGFSNYPAFLTGKRKFRELALLSTVASIIFLFTHVLGISWYNTTFSLVIAYLAGRIIPDVVGFWYSRRFIIHKKVDQNLLGYGSFLTAVNTLPWISGHIGSIILGSLLGVEALAVYSVSTRFLVAVQKNFVVYYKPVTAKLAAQSSLQHYESLKKHWLKLLLIGCLLALSLFLTTPLLVSFFFTSQYEDAVRFGQWASLALVPIPLSWVLTDVLIYQQKRHAQVAISIFPQLLKILLYFILIPKLGISALIFILLLERFSEPLIPLWTLVRDRHKNDG